MTAFCKSASHGPMWQLRQKTCGATEPSRVRCRATEPSRWIGLIGSAWEYGEKVGVSEDGGPYANDTRIRLAELEVLVEPRDPPAAHRLT